jgi:hypothetical protein
MNAFRSMLALALDDPASGISGYPITSPTDTIRDGYQLVVVVRHIRWGYFNDFHWGWQSPDCKWNDKPGWTNPARTNTLPGIVFNNNIFQKTEVVGFYAIKVSRPRAGWDQVQPTEPIPSQPWWERRIDPYEPSPPYTPPSNPWWQR